MASNSAGVSSQALNLTVSLLTAIVVGVVASVLIYYLSNLIYKKWPTASPVIVVVVSVVILALVGFLVAMASLLTTHLVAKKRQEQLVQQMAGMNPSLTPQKAGLSGYYSPTPPATPFSGPPIVLNI